ncbi:MULTISPECIES: hypothetical protein [unclassified Solwaraspora]|uniref:hypothetical protein n=1 Tax=unclassified Solwaraspora TaxID=2627926 RepID=UPI00248C77D7|nr:MULTISPECIES: hypothetical protein [unclassified Solwaraspora]WBB96742.1 hypothetical protein O7553_26215 [Solwaraspora sp. WMMA2059]WBC19354.1 hypothetical protein O7543_21155 [Solwaraspora sp. WMMA2080]WJK33203.1 hypothetical protein O7610_21180 [Solwaraspora sp. WMMA2065]
MRLTHVILAFDVRQPHLDAFSADFALLRFSHEHADASRRSPGAAAARTPARSPPSSNGIAHDLGTLYAGLDRTYEQNDRIKDTLRRWQSSRATAAGS